jgi:hypothetical protein
MRVGLLPFILMMEGANQEDDSATLMPRMDKVLLTYFVDRWRPETHTFHLPFGSLWQDDNYTQGYHNAHWLADKGQASGLPYIGNNISKHFVIYNIFTDIHIMLQI